MVDDLTYGYKEGLLSNSMIQDYLSCSHKAIVKWEQPNPQTHTVSVTFAGTVIHKVLEDELQNPSAWVGAAYKVISDSQIFEAFDIGVLQKYYEFVAAAIRAKPYLKAPGYNNPRATNMLESLRSKNPLLDNCDAVGFFDVICVSIFRGKEMQLGAIYKKCTREFKLELPELMFGCKFVGTADLVYVGKKTLFIGDYKTGSKTWTKDVIKNSPQFNLYAMILRRMTGLNIAVNVHVIAIKTGDIITYDLTLEDEARFLEKLEKDARVVRLTRSRDHFSLAADSDIGCPCELLKQNRCPYKAGA